MKKLYLFKMDILWNVEKFSGWLWGVLCFGRVSYWLDFLPAWAYRNRKNAERRYIDKFHETIYGESLCG